MKKYKIKDLAKTGSGGTPTSSRKEFYEGGTIPWINSGELSQSFITNTTNYITELGYNSSSAKMFPKDDTVLLAMYGATAGKASLLRIDACTNQAICAIMPDKTIADPLYLKYKLDTMYDYLVRLSSGSARDNLSQAGIANLEISLPSLPEQKRIASVLSTLDKKIALNRQINQNLEALARQLYDYWFVQFDFPDANAKPYKSSGGKMVYNTQLKREIPEGWEVKEIGSILDKIKSSTKLTTNEFSANGMYPIIDQATDTYYAGFTDREDAVLDQYPAVVFGDHSCAVKYVNFPFVRGADGTQVMISKEPRVSTEYLYFAVKDVKIGKGYARHYSFLKSSLIIVPSQAVALKFREKADNLLNQITHRREEILSLTKQRDELLPLLMNGQVNFDLSAY